jgi:hypothetical protein
MGGMANLLAAGANFVLLPGSKQHSFFTHVV